MRLLTAFIPAGVITLLLFTLMQYLITGGRQPLTLPAQSEIVDLIRLRAEQVEADAPSARPTPPRQQSQANPPLPQMPVSAAEPPRLASPAMAVPEVPPPELASGPYLGVFDPPPLAVGGVHPAQQAHMAADDSPPTPSQTEPADPPATANALGLTDGLATDRGHSNPVPLLRIEPDYPRKAARTRKEGWVKLAFTITERGTVIDPVVLDSRPRRVFNRSALTAIRKWRFRPKVVDGSAVPTRATQVIEFKLAGR